MYRFCRHNFTWKNNNDWLQRDECGRIRGGDDDDDSDGGGGDGDDDDDDDTKEEEEQEDSNDDNSYMLTELYNIVTQNIKLIIVLCKNWFDTKTAWFCIHLLECSWTSESNILSDLLQGSTIKPLVALLNIARLRKGKETLNNEINDNVSDGPIQVRQTPSFSK